MAIYEASFVFLSTTCLLLYLLTANSIQQSAAGGDGSFRRFQRKYLTVYLMAQGRVSLFELRSDRSMVVAFAEDGARQLIVFIT